MDRNWLNERLLSEADQLKNVKVVFEHKLVKCDVSKGSLTFLHNGKEKNATADVIIGADGVYSQVRTGLMRTVKYVPPTFTDQNGFCANLYRLCVV
jgi:kynurenine 3-monooxygenase